MKSDRLSPGAPVYVDLGNKGLGGLKASRTDLMFGICIAVLPGEDSSAWETRSITVLWYDVGEPKLQTYTGWAMGHIMVSRW